MIKSKQSPYANTTIDPDHTCGEMENELSLTVEIRVTPVSVTVRIGGDRWEVRKERVTRNDRILAYKQPEYEKPYDAALDMLYDDIYGISGKAKEFLEKSLGAII